MHGNALIALGCPLKLMLTVIWGWLFHHFFAFHMVIILILAVGAAEVTYPLLVLISGYLNAVLYGQDALVGQPIYPETPSSKNDSPS